MKGLDLLLAVIAVLCFAAYMAVLIWKVPSPALIVVSLIGIVMAAYDFGRTFWRSRGGSGRSGAANPP